MEIASRPAASLFPSAMGKYEPFARLGMGGMADVFLAMARGPAGFNKLVVIKRLRNPDAGQHLAMFLDEARLAARLSHPNVVHTYEVGDTGGRYFLAMEYLEGQALHAIPAELTARGIIMNEALVASILAQALKGLHYAHELTDFDGTPLGIVHRDISPHNLFITYSGEVKLLDFGIAKAAVNSSHTETGMLKGKIRYMSPEQVGESRVDRRADLFACGVVLWELLARRPLFQGDSISILTRLVGEDAPLLPTVVPEVSPALAAITQKALQRDPARRYATAEEMRVDLERFLRTRDDAPTEREVARFMDDLFAEKRDTIRARIRAFLAELPASDDGLAPASKSGSLPMLEGSDPIRAPHSMSVSGVVPSEPTMAETPRARRGRARAIGIAAALALLVVFIGVAATRGARTGDASVAGASVSMRDPPQAAMRDDARYTPPPPSASAPLADAPPTRAPAPPANAPTARAPVHRAVAHAPPPPPPPAASSAPPPPPRPNIRLIEDENP